MQDLSTERTPSSNQAIAIEILRWSVAKMLACWTALDEPNSDNENVDWVRYILSSENKTDGVFGNAA